MALCSVDEDKLIELIVAAEMLVWEFDNYGEVLQEDEHGDYGPDSALGRLRAAVEGIK